MSDFLFDFILPLLFFILLFISIMFLFENRENEIKKEVIEHSKDFTLYHECIYLNDKYYCRNEE